MKALLALLLTASPALAIELVSPGDSAVLERRLLTCKSHADFDKAYELGLAKDHEAIRAFVMPKLQARECIYLPKGMKVYAVESRGRLECLRPEGDRKCFWTVPYIFLAKNGRLRP
jgi:hypothetical protein